MLTKWLLLELLLLLVVACSQNYSEKKVEDALREKGFVPVPHGSSHVEREKNEFDGKLWGELVPEIPDGWISRTPSSSMRLAEYILPSDTGAEKPILAVFSGIGGTVDENINRWYGQFEQPDGSPTAKSAKRWEVDVREGISATMVDIRGTFKGGMGPSAGKVRRKFRMLAAIIETRGTFYHIKLTGLQNEVERFATDFERLIAGLILSG